MNEAHKQIEVIKQKMLEDALAQCTIKQREIFKALYPNGPKEGQMEWAIQQCFNTIKKNTKTNQNTERSLDEPYSGEPNPYD